jgi:hypothetical protein
LGPLVILRGDDGQDDVLVARRARLRERLTARLATHRLDNQLARGMSPEDRAPLALRAQALGELGSRRTIARQLRRVVEDARCRRRRARAQIPIVHEQVLAAAPELEHLAEVLELGRGPLAARGLAQARLLLCDGASPLYLRSTPTAVRRAVEVALLSLEPVATW